MITILLAGQARVGKTTAANYIASLAKKMDYKPVILPFANAIKKEAEAKGFTKDVNPVEYRNFCQTIGEAKRKENPDHWVNMFLHDWKALATKDMAESQSLDKIWKETVVIADDCRYLNELNLGKKIGAKCIFISRGTRILEDQDADWRKHESETMSNLMEAKHPDYADIFNYIIKNDETKDAFNEKIQNRIGLLLDATPMSYVDCDCVGCQHLRKDERMKIEDYFKDMFGGDNED